MPYSCPSQQFVTFLHLVDRPCQNRFGFAHVDNDWVHQVRKPGVAAQFDHLRVDHQHPHFIRSPSHQDGRDDRVQANAFAGTGSPGDEQVRQACKIHSEGFTRYVFSEKQWYFLLANLRPALFDNFSHPNNLPMFVGHFDTNAIFTRNRSHNSNAGHSKGNGEIVGQACDLAQSQSGFKLDFVLRDHGPGFDFYNPNVEPKFGKRLLEDFGFFLDFFSLFVVGNLIGLRQ